MRSAWLDLLPRVPLILALLGLWWVIRRQPDEPPAPEDDGGVRRGEDRHPPLRPVPRRPRRGPHGDLPLPAPPRVRSIRARARSYGH